MKKVILIPDSFKGTMSSAEICTVMAQAVQEYYPDAQVHSVPVADGGEGSVDSFLQAVGGEKVSRDCKRPVLRGSARVLRHAAGRCGRHRDGGGGGPAAGGRAPARRTDYYLRRG
ncbi:MAG: glycerate kinase [Ruthenibacterium lactatiformans]